MGIGKSVSAVNTPLTPSLRTQCYPKFFNKNGEISVPQIVCVFTVAGAGRPGAQSGRLGTGGDATVPVQVEGVGAQHAQDRKVSKVEVINNVIDYICDLQMALDVHHHAALVSVMLNNNNSSSSNNNNNNNNNNVVVDPTAARQPLCVIPTAPNAFANTCAQEMNPLDKSSSCADCSSSRTVSC